MNHKHLRLLQVIILAAFFLLNPLIIGSLYVTFLVLRWCMPNLMHGKLYFILMCIVISITTLVIQIIFPIFPSVLLAIIFMVSMALTIGKPPVRKIHINRQEPVYEEPYEDEDIIEAEVISERTVND